MLELLLFIHYEQRKLELKDNDTFKKDQMTTSAIRRLSDNIFRQLQDFRLIDLILTIITTITMKRYDNKIYKKSNPQYYGC